MSDTNPTAYPTLDIRWLGHDGLGGGRDGDSTVWVRGALPGDTVRYEVERQRKRTVWGRLVELISPSPDRISARCPHHPSHGQGPGCGGCDLAALRPDARVNHLKATAERLLGHPISWVPCPRPHAHRARIKLSLSGGVGYRAAQRHDLVPIEACGAARPEVQAAIRPLLQLPRQGLTSVELRSDGSRVVYSFASDGPVPRAVRDALGGLGDVALDGRRLAGDPNLWLDVHGLALRASPLSFYQVHLQGNQGLVADVVSAVSQATPERILDLYCGIGNLSLPLAQLAPVLGVEREGQATADFQHNAARAELPAQVRALSVERFDPSREPFDVVVLDPPRAGAPKLLPRLARSRPRCIVYISCHLPSAMRDLRGLQGYELVSVRCHDLFPDTHHFETVLVLTRR